MVGEGLWRREARVLLEEALADSPVVLVHGPRQCGKSTLARLVGETRGFTYVTLDDPVTLNSAVGDPLGFVSDLSRHTIIDEIQRAPGLFLPLKVVVDRDRQPGRFLLTGSANVLALPAMSDSLAGRIEIVRLAPLAQCELSGHTPTFLDALFEGRFTVGQRHRQSADLPERIVAGGYPAALRRGSPRRRAAWYRDYLETMVKRDVRNLTRIDALDAVARLVELVAGQTARLINVAELSSPFQLSRPTIRDYVLLLETMFLIERLPPWHSNRLSRLVKTPKLHIGDTGLAAALLGLDETTAKDDGTLYGQLVETFVFQELRRQAAWHARAVQLFHFRDRDGVEVDIVLERGSQEVAGVEVKASATVTSADFRGLRKLREACGRRFAAGVVLYDGEATAGFGDGLYAVPVRRLWAS